MKLVYGLSSVVIVSCLGANSGIALAKVTEQVSNPASLSQTEPVLVANLFRRLQEAVQTIQQVDQVVDSVNSLVEQENRRRELEAAREAATEQQRLEAERRQQYFESLSPEEQQAYIEQQQALQAQREQAANLFILGLGAMMFGGASGESEPEQSPSYEDLAPDPVCGYGNDDAGNLVYNCR